MHIDIFISGLPPREGLKLVINLSQNKKFKLNIDLGIKEILPSILPSDILEKSNDKLNICITQVYPPVGAATIISKFNTINELVDVVAASCFIPLYSNQSTFFTKIRDKPGELFMGKF